MVTMAELRDMNVANWTASANEWNINAGKLLGAARDLRDLAKAPLVNGGWTGPAGQQAAARIQSLIDKLVIASVECKAISLVTHGLNG